MVARQRSHGRARRLEGLHRREAARRRGRARTAPHRHPRRHRGAPRDRRLSRPRGVRPVELDPPDYPAPAKLNLFLHVVGRRRDGYHLLQSAFTLIDRCDVLRFRTRNDGAITRVNDVPGVASAEDLTVRAARLLQEASGTAQGVDIEIDKRIPVGGGLGGGSSDAATALLALNALWQTGFEREALAEIGAGLGADVPFFIFCRSAW